MKRIDYLKVNWPLHVNQVTYTVLERALIDKVNELVDEVNTLKNNSSSVV
jgi:hypothetical protein